MLSLFRRFFQSKIGLPIFIGFLVVMAFAFAAADITGTSFNGLSADSRVAVVGKEPITASEVSTAADVALEQVRGQFNPTITMPEFIEQDGLEEVVKQLIDRYAISAYAQKYGLRAGRNLVDSEILKIPGFRGATGEFDQAVYQAALRQRGITDAVLRRDLRDGLLEQQLFEATMGAPRLPEKVARQYAALVLERRQGEIALIPSAAFAPAGDPSAQQLEAWYKDNRSRFVRPERRVLRFAVFNTSQLGVDPTPSAAEIAARFKANAAAYQASEKRAVSYFIVPTEDAAKSFVARLGGGLSLEAAARDAGFNVAKGEVRTREELATATSAAFADNAFKAADRGIITPTRGSLGWYVARVDKVERIPARTLAQASGEIAAQLRKEKLAAAVAQRTSEIEAELDSGTALADVAKTYGLKVDTTPELLADGRIYGPQGGQVIQQLLPLVTTAFQMDESSPQLAELTPGSEYIIFDVARIEESRAAPLAEVRAEAIAAWKRAEGAKLARAAADRVLKKVTAGTPLAAALAAENKPAIERQQINLKRRELMAQRNGNVPPPLVLLFSMAQGSAKKLEAPQDIGWYIVDLAQITTDPVDGEPGLIDQTRRSLAPALSQEYRAQVTAAIRKEVGVERNEAAIDALRKQLSGGI
ncbi:MAG: SurA N-terminal domain-containing protein [Porphyrobacter sp.]|jgi:peptidyl-prolyl cis-trans isomerase D|nr:SurA N-terminal domain-containing protein [Porphyrobacter sp.]